MSTVKTGDLFRIRVMTPEDTPELAVKVAQGDRLERAMGVALCEALDRCRAGMPLLRCLLCDGPIGANPGAVVVIMPATDEPTSADWSAVCLSCRDEQHATGIPLLTAVRHALSRIMGHELRVLNVTHEGGHA